jgi:hypothetical protein
MAFYQYNRCILSCDQLCYHIVVVRVLSDYVTPEDEPCDGSKHVASFFLTI